MAFVIRVSRKSPTRDVEGFTPQVRNPIGLNIKICMHTFNFIADFAELDSIQLIAIIQPREAFLHVGLFLLVNP